MKSIKRDFYFFLLAFGVAILGFYLEYVPNPPFFYDAPKFLFGGGLIQNPYIYVSISITLIVTLTFLFIYSFNSIKKGKKVHIIFSLVLLYSLCFFGHLFIKNSYYLKYDENCPNFSKNVFFVYLTGPYHVEKIPQVYTWNFQCVQGIGKTSHQVYYGLDDTVRPDPKTFQYIGDQYFKDKDHVYYSEEVVLGGDPETFEVIKQENTSTIFTYSKDKNSVFFGRDKIIDADPSGFEILKEIKPNRDKPYMNTYAKDKNYIFQNGLKLEGIDIQSFSVLGIDISGCSENEQYFGKYYTYTKDKNSVFYNGKKIVADVSSFGFSPYDFFTWRDKNGYYCDGVLVTKSNNL